MSQLLNESGPQAIKLALAGAATGGVYLFGAWDIILQALVAMVVIDYITGVMAAYVEKSLNSEVGMKGWACAVAVMACRTSRCCSSLAWSTMRLTFSACSASMASTCSFRSATCASSVARSCSSASTCSS